MSATLSSMAQACANNRNTAEWQLKRIRQQIQDAMPGEVTDAMRCELAKFKAEFEHWSEYCLYYRQRIAKEGAEAAVSLGGFGAREPRQPQATQPQHDTRLPREREPGEDDGEELSF